MWNFFDEPKSSPERMQSANTSAHSSPITVHHRSDPKSLKVRTTPTKIQRMQPPSPAATKKDTIRKVHQAMRVVVVAELDRESSLKTKETHVETEVNAAAAHMIQLRKLRRNY